MIFKTNKETDSVSNPYLNAKREWNHSQLSLVSSRLGWQIIALSCLMITLAAVGGLIYIGSQSKFVPYVVKVDKLGEALAIAPAQKAHPADKQVIKATLAEFITNARLVTPDVSIQRKAIFNVYAHISKNDPAALKMNEWLTGINGTPFDRASKLTVETQIQSVLQQSEQSWQIDWTEIERSRDGEIVGKSTMRSLVNIYTVSPTVNTTEEQIRINPLGIYIKDFSWSRQD